MKQRDSVMPTLASGARFWRVLVLRHPVNSWLAWLLFGLTCVFAALDFLCLALTWATPVPDTWGSRGDAAFIALALGAVGQLLARHRPQNRIGWLFLAAGLAAGIYRSEVEYSTYALLTVPGALPGGILAAWMGSWLWIVTIGALYYAFLLFPTGQLPSARWRPAAWVVVSAFALLIFGSMLKPGPLYLAPYLDNPIATASSSQAVSLLIQIASAGVGLGAILVGASVLLRLRHAQGVERQQLKWFVYVAALSSVIGLINVAGPFMGQYGIGPKSFQFFTVAILIAIPLTVGLAILRYQLWDIDLIIHRTLVYGTLSAGVLITYLLTVGLFGALFSANVSLAAAIVTAGLAALLFQPLRARLQHQANRMTFGAADLPSPSHEIEESHDPSEKSSTRKWLALAHVLWWVAAAVAVLIFAAAIPLGYAPWMTGASLGYLVDAPPWYLATMSVTQGIVSMLVASVSLALAGILYWKRRADPMALVVSFYLLAYGITLGGPLEALNGFAPLFPGVSIQADVLIPTNVILGIQTALFLPILLLLYLFPNGRFVPGWTRYCAFGVLVLAPFFVRIMASEWISSLTPSGWASAIAFLLLMSAGLYAQIYRYRRVATAVERQQTKWAVFGFLLSFLVLGILQIPYVTISQIPPGSTHPWWQPLMGLGWWASLCILPLSLAISVLGYRLWDIDFIANRALVFILLTGSIVTIYVLLVVSLGKLFETSGNLLISLVATALAAILFQPLRERLQRGVNRLMYGERDDPYAVLSRLGQRLEAALAPEAVLPAIVETLAQALKLPYAGIALKEGDESLLAAEYFLPRSNEVRRGGETQSFQGTAQVIPLLYHTEVIGELRLAPRAPGESFNAADRRLLEQFAHQAGAAASAVRLNRELQHSRERLVVAREEERRRIRRDLHDGLGPVLASLAMQADTAREWTHTDPERSEAALADITVRAQGALQDIRRLVYDLRPPALDELGLLGALRQAVANVPAGLHIEIDAPDRLPPLSAAAEVAAYRILQETLNNVLRHSHARNCTVRISAQDELQLEMNDDGVGLPPDVRAGVGLVSMRERASELGGSCVVESMPSRGTRVLARLPLERG